MAIDREATRRVRRETGDSDVVVYQRADGLREVRTRGRVSGREVHLASQRDGTGRVQDFGEVCAQLKERKRLYENPKAGARRLAEADEHNANLERESERRASEARAEMDCIARACFRGHVGVRVPIDARSLKR